MRMIEKVHAADITSMHCGGTIERIYEPESSHELADLIRSLNDFYILGAGTNTIFEDMRITKPVIRLGKEFSTIEPFSAGLTVGATAPMKHLVSYCVRNGLSGLEFMAGIPGLVGGALFMNAGTPDRGILDTVMELEVVNSSGISIIKREELEYTYRRSGIPEKTVITSTKLALNTSTKEEVRKAAMPYIIKKRTQPRGFSSGSIFQNPKGMAAGMLIEKTGLKGFKVGGAHVSKIHANFIINDGTATTTDIRDLIGIIKEKVLHQFGIVLAEEVKIIGQ